MIDQEVARRFHEIWYTSKTTWQKNTWLGVPNQQNPMDMWIGQEILFKTKPDFIVECGAFHGGSAAMWAMILQQVNPEGRIISIDIEDRMGEVRKLPIVKEKVEFLVRSSTAPEVVAAVKKRVGGKKAMLLLDSDHSKAHVLNELNAYWGARAGRRMHQRAGYERQRQSRGTRVRSGADGSSARIFGEERSVSIDLEQERLLLTFHPNGWLKRVK